MNLYSEFSDDQGRLQKEWNYCHPSGFAGLVVEYFYHSGELSSLQFFVDGKSHRPVADGPAYESFHKNGQTSTRQFYVDGKLHRPVSEGPAIESFYESGQVQRRTFYVDGKEMVP